MRQVDGRVAYVHQRLQPIGLRGLRTGLGERNHHDLMTSRARQESL
jgi:hypothetical protein